MLSYTPIVHVQVNPAIVSQAGTAFSTGLLLCPTAGDVPEEEVLRLFHSADELLTAGFEESDPAYLAAVAYFAADPAPDRLYVALYPAAAGAISALRSILESGEDFYGICCLETVPARLEALVADFPSVAGRHMLFVSATGTVAEQISSTGLIRQAFRAGSPRILSVYGPDIYAAPAVLGTAMGLSRARGRNAFALCYQEVPGMLPTDLKESEITSLKALNGNVYITRGNSRNLLENGAAASGSRFAEVLALDRISADLQDAAISLLTDSPGALPQTDETSAVFINRFSAVLSEYAASGILATGRWRGRAVGSLAPGDVVENGYRMWADSYDTQSDTDRAAHRAMPIHVALCMAGSVESLEIEVDVSL